MLGYICLGISLLIFVPTFYSVIRGCFDKKYRDRLEWKSQVYNRWMGLKERKKRRNRKYYAPYRPRKGTLQYRIWKQQGRL